MTRAYGKNSLEYRLGAKSELVLRVEISSACMVAVVVLELHVGRVVNVVDVLSLGQVYLSVYCGQIRKG